MAWQSMTSTWGLTIECSLFHLQNNSLNLNVEKYLLWLIRLMLAKFEEKIDLFIQPIYLDWTDAEVLTHE